MKTINSVFTPVERKVYQFLDSNKNLDLAYRDFRTIPPFDTVNNLHVTIMRIRRKLKQIDPQGEIVTLRGYGYRYEQKT